MRLRTLPECPLWPEDAPAVAPKARFEELRATRAGGFFAEVQALIAWLVRLRFFWLAVGVFAGAFMEALLS